MILTEMRVFKKEKDQIAGIVLLLFFTAISGNSVAQIKITGTFSRTTPGGESAQQYFFYDGYRFDFVQSQNFEVEKSSGYYFLEQDTLFLIHQKNKNNRKSSFKLKFQTLKTDFSQQIEHSFIFYLYDYQKNSIDGINIVATDKQNKIISGKVTDSEGYASLNREEGIENVIIHGIGYKRLTIRDIKKLEGNEIVVSLARSGVSGKKDDELEKFIFETDKSNEIISFFKKKSSSKYVKKE